MTTTQAERKASLDADRGQGLMHVAQSVQYALAIWPSEVAARRTIRALLPEGEVRWVGAQQHWKRMQKGSPGGKNRVSDRFQKSLFNLERHGHIQRGQDFVLIKARRPLFDLALEGVENPSHKMFLDLENGIAAVNRQMLEDQHPRLLEQRRLELAFIRSLMKAPDSSLGSMRSGTQAVRHVPAQRPL